MPLGRLTSWPFPSWVLLLALLGGVARPSSRDIAQLDPENDPLVPVEDDIEQGGLDMGFVVRVLR